MTVSRRRALVGVLTAPALIAASRLGSAAPSQTLSISHQFRGGSIDERRGLPGSALLVGAVLGVNSPSSTSA
jgi:hypothetical protein